MADYRTVSPDVLEPFAARVFEGLGSPPDVAATVAGHLVRANLSGHDSHGVLRIPQYASWIDGGHLKPAARPEVVHRRGAALLVDAGYGYGQFATKFTLERAMEVAREQGVAAATIRNTNHIGRLGEYGERAAAQGMVAIVTVGAAGPGIGGATPFGGAARFLGTNPWTIGIPRGDHGARGGSTSAASGSVDAGLPSDDAPPFLMDFATTVVAEGKVRVYRAKHEALPPGCIVDRHGNPSTDPEEFYGGGMLLPFGGHKGYGLALASALLGGLAAIGQQEPSMAGAAGPPETPNEGDRTGGVFMVVVDPNAFGSAADYAASVERVTAAAKRVPPAPGVDEVLVPGEPEARSRAQRARGGIALPHDTWAAIAEVAQRVGVPMPGVK
jgi:hydroxycarboxylate dehydrogenase B